MRSTALTGRPRDEHSLAKNLTDSGPDRWSCVIVDEAHGYKNPASKRYEELELSARRMCSLA